MGTDPESFSGGAHCQWSSRPIPTRRVLEAVLWVLNTGAQWHMLPQSYPNYKTVHRLGPTPVKHFVNPLAQVHECLNGHS